jgi:hypothetical protein
MTGAPDTRLLVPMFGYECFSSEVLLRDKEIQKHVVKAEMSAASGYSASWRDALRWRLR